VDIRKLRCFVAVADELHFGRAASRLHVAGPAVSQTIRSLEHELGLTLFNRSNRRVELTEAGHLLLEEANAVLDRFDAAQATMARLRSAASSGVRVGAVPALPPQLIPDLLARCAADAPDIDVVVTALPAGRSLRDALGYGSDLILTRGEIAEPDIHSAVVARERLGVALPREHHLAAQAAIRPVELNDVPLIAFSRASDATEFDRIFGALATAGLARPRLVHESHPGAVEASLRLVARGAGLSLKLQSEVEAFASDDLEWRPLTVVDIEVVISAAWLPDGASQALRRMLPLLAR
jgi:DNA-binding transcriptional LysR family regulator